VALVSMLVVFQKKKIFYNASSIRDTLKVASNYCFNTNDEIPSFDWNKFKVKRDIYIKHLNGIYARNLDIDKITVYSGFASFFDKNTVQVQKEGEDDIHIEGKRILIAVGGEPIFPNVPGAELGISSDGFFELQAQPKRIAIVGAGYIAVELSGIFRALGSEVIHFTRTSQILRAFDPVIGDTVKEEMLTSGIKFINESNIISLERAGSDSILLKYHTKDNNQGQSVEVDCVLWAIGRRPLSSKIRLEETGVKVKELGHIQVNEYQQSDLDHVFALGDVTGEAELTPVAIASGRKLSDRLFGPPNFRDSKQDYQNIPTIIFSHPPSGTIGLSEAQAIEAHGRDNVKVYKSRFTNLYYSMMDSHKPPTMFKLICAGPEEKVVGLHLVGMGVEEMLQGFGVAIKMGATKKDFDSCVAIHPTSSEEIVTMR